MPLALPPELPGALGSFPPRQVKGLRLWRIYRHRDETAAERSPWWFGSANPRRPRDGGRFDLMPPHGTAYWATSPVAAMLETFQGFTGRVPAGEVRRRRLASTVVPADGPPAADLTARAARGWGITAARTAAVDRPVTRAWAEAFHADGWRALFGAVQHDTTHRLRALTLLDIAGAHPPTIGGPWPLRISAITDNEELARELAAYGLHIGEDSVELTLVEPEDLI